MKKILVVEDDSFKSKSLCDFLYKFFENPTIDLAASLVEGISLVNNNVYDLIFVDMAIPSHPSIPGGGAPMSLLTGGLDILLELKYLERCDPCFIITQYPDIEIGGQFYSIDDAAEEIKQQLGCAVLACISYNEGSDSWKASLCDKLYWHENISPRR